MKNRNHESGVRAFAFRLKPHQDLKKEIIAFARRKNISAGFILTCVGSLEQLHVRFANQKTGKIKKAKFEITGLCGTLSKTSAHLHLTVADLKGKSSGGHLLEQTLIYTTAEIVIGSLIDLEFDRVKDGDFLELVVKS